MSLQVCHCGWSKVTTYQGLRTHQGKMGCTPKGMKVEESEQQYMWGYTNYQKSLKLDAYTSAKSADHYPDQSHQVCHCGWSKVTTYQGLRIHQGKKGCTPRGMKVEESEQQYMWGYTNYQKSLKLDAYTSAKSADHYPDQSLQVCHCGWSKVTTYQGLRTHQGKMGCTPKGVRIQEKEQYAWKSQWEEVHQKEYLTAKRTTVKKENAPPSTNVRYNSSATAVTIKEEYSSYTAALQYSSQRSTRPKSCRQLQDSSRDEEYAPSPPSTQARTSTAATTATIKNDYRSCMQVEQMNRWIREHPPPTYPATVVQPQEKDRNHQTLSQIADRRVMTGNQTISSRTDLATAARTKEEPKSPIPQQPSQRATNSALGRQPYDSLTGVQACQERLKSELQQKLQLREKKTSEMKAAERDCEELFIEVLNSVKQQQATNSASGCQPYDSSTGVQVNRSVGERPPVPPKIADRRVMAGNPTISSRADPATATRIKEEPKSPLAIPQRPSQRATNSASGCQPYDSSTGVQVNGSVKERPPVPPKVRSLVREHPTAANPAVVQPKEKHKEDQTLSQNEPVSTSINSAMATPIKEKPKSPFAAPRRSVQRATNSNAGNQLQELSTGVPARQERRESELQQKFQLREKRMSENRTAERDCENEPVSTSIDSATVATSKARPKSPFATPQRSVQRATNSNAGNQLQELSTGVPACQDRLKSELQQKFQLREKIMSEMRTAERDCESVPNSMSTNAQINAAAAETKTKEYPKSLCDTAQPDVSTGMKVKELAQMFSATTTEQKAVRPKEKPREEQKISQGKPLGQETAVQSEKKDREVQKLSQSVPDSASASNQINHASEAATPEEDPKSSCEAAELSDFSTGLKVKDLARMFSANATQETAVRPKDKRREEQKLSQGKCSAITVQETAVQPKEEDKENQKIPQNVPDSTNTTNQMNPASAEASAEEDPKSTCETAELSGFSAGLKVKDLARMFSAVNTQETAVRPKGKPNVSKWI